MAKVKWLGATLAVSAKQHGGAIQLTTPVQRIDRSRLGGGKGDRNR
ncbi:MAG: hypothetical protein HC840_29945 [Leptolyngbyaceae cyanobacterium RM2_2_4]|nr:hypothetical protein [Leptolyngbyaceae cyanobacterium RM2_2_4]